MKRSKASERPYVLSSGFLFQVLVRLKASEISFADINDAPTRNLSGRGKRLSLEAVGNTKDNLLGVRKRMKIG